MGRAGAGGGGGEHSGGGHSSGRSSGGHHVSSGSSGRRAGGGSFSGNNSYHGYHNYNGPFGGPPPYRGYGRGMFPTPGLPPRYDTVIVNSNPFGGVMAFIVTIIIVFVLAFGMKISNNSSMIIIVSLIISDGSITFLRQKKPLNTFMTKPEYNHM